MIDKAMTFLHGEIDQFLKLSLESTEEKVFMTTILKQDGKLDLADNALGMALINVEEEYVVHQRRTHYPTDAQQYNLINPTQNINLYMLFPAHFGSTEEAYKFLNLLMTFFQGTNVFRQEEYPELEAAGIEKLIAKLYNCSFEKLSQIWGMVGAKYMPSVMYKVHLIGVQQNRIIKTIPAIVSTETEVNGN